MRESGVFIEELQKLFLNENLKTIPFLGVQVFNIEKSLSELKDMIFKQTRLTDFSQHQ